MVCAHHSHDSNSIGHIVEVLQVGTHYLKLLVFVGIWSDQLQGMLWQCLERIGTNFASVVLGCLSRGLSVDTLSQRRLTSFSSGGPAPACPSQQQQNYTERNGACHHYRWTSREETDYAELLPGSSNRATAIATPRGVQDLDFTANPRTGG